MIKAVIFDYNGVLTYQGTFDHLIETYSQNSGKDTEALRKLVRYYWDLAKLAKIDSFIFWEKVAEFLNYNPHQLRREWIDWFGFRKEILPVIKHIKKKNKTALLTNEIKDWTEEAVLKYSLHDYFDIILPSYEAQAAKPDPAVFKILLQKLQLAPAECIYTDDLEKNIVASRALGFIVIPFRSLDSFILELKRQGLELDAFS